MKGRTLNSAEDNLTISVAYDPVDATFKGKFSKDGNRLPGGWRPDPGIDETINVPYDIEGTRVKWTCVAETLIAEDEALIQSLSSEP